MTTSPKSVPPLGRFFSVLTGALALTASIALAEEPTAPAAGKEEEEVVKLSPYEVRPDSTQGYIASETISGSRAVMKIFEVPATLSVVTRDLIDDMGSNEPVNAMMKAVPGVSPVGTPGPNAGVYIRGFRAQNWSVDGATINSYAMANNFNIDALEVVKGPSAILFGPFGAYGGYVNMVPKWARKNAINTVEVTTGTDAYYSAMLDYGQALGAKENLQYRMVLGYLDAGRAGYPGDFNRTLTIAPSFAVDIGERSRLKVRLDYQDTNNLWSRTAMDATGKILRDFSSSGGLPGLQTDDQNWITQTVFTAQMSDEWSVKFNFLTNNEEYLNRIGNLVNVPTPRTNYQYVQLLQEIKYKSWYADFAATWEVEDIGPGLSNQLVVAGNMNHWQQEYLKYRYTGTAGLYPDYNVAPYTTFDPTHPDWAGVSNIILDADQLGFPYNVQWLGGLIATDTLGLFNNKVKINFGTRYTYDNRYYKLLSRSSRSAAFTTTVTEPTISKVFLYRYGLVYEPTSSLALYYGHDEGYLSVPSYFMFDGSRLRPESGLNNEVGVKLNFFKALGGSFSGSLAYFRLEVTDKWRADPLHPGYYLQDGLQKNNGFDGQLMYESPRLSGLVGLYTGDGPTVAFTGVRANIVPKQTFVSWLKFNVTDRFSVGGGYRHQGDTLNIYGTAGGEAYGTCDLFATYTMKLQRGRITYRLGVSNVTDETAAYQVSSPADVYTEDARQVKLTATYTW